MSDSNRVKRWRQQQRAAGKDAWTIWVPRELKLYVEDIALKRHCSPSDLVEQALTTCYPLSADVTDTVTDTDVTDTLQIRLALQQELRAFFAGSPRLQGIGSIHGVTDTVTDTLSQPVTDTVTDTHTQTEAVAVDPGTGHITDTVTDTLPSAGRAPCVTDTVTDTVHVTDTVTATDATPTAKRKATSRQRHVTAPVTDTVPPSEPKRRGRPPVLRPGILALLDEHPDGLTAAELKVYLGTEKPIGDTLAGMVKAQLLVKSGTGQGLRYHLARASAQEVPA